MRNASEEILTIIMFVVSFVAITCWIAFAIHNSSYDASVKNGFFTYNNKIYVVTEMQHVVD